MDHRSLTDFLRANARELREWLWVAGLRPMPVSDAHKNEAAAVLNLPEPLKSAESEVALQEALRQHSEVLKARDSMEAKLGAAIKTAGTLAAILVAAIGAFDVPASVQARVALGFFLGAALVAFVPLRGVSWTAAPTVFEMVRGFRKTPHSRAWLIAHLGIAIECNRRQLAAVARYQKLAVFLIALGIAALFFVLGTLVPPADNGPVETGVELRRL